MKKSLFFLMMMVLLGSCTDQQFVKDLTDGSSVSQTDEIQTLVEKAKWGDGQAYMSLADCYRDGKGVEKDFIGMISMLKMAEQFGGIRRMEDYLETMPEDSEFRLIFDAFELYEHRKVEEAMAKTEQLIAQGSPDGYSMKSIIAMESGNTREAKQLVEMAVKKGSSLAELLLCCPEWRGVNNLDVEKLKSLADRMPLACQLLANMYTGNDDESLKDESLASYYYQKADEQAFLGKEGAIWLLNYYKKSGNIHLSERDMQRFRILAGEAQEEYLDDVEHN